MSHRIAGFWVVLVTFACPVLHAAERSFLALALKSIAASDLSHHVDVLADDSFEGREAGTRGGRAAAGYLQNELRKYGLRGAGHDAGFFQPFGDQCRNVLAMIEGSDPVLKQEFILIGAHYDHVGYGSARTSYGPTGYIHNGADDNASGVSGVLELAEAFTILGGAPKRSLLFAFWDGEEKGLLGSQHFVAHPTVPLNRIVFAINSDMIGRLRDDKLEFFGTRSLVGLRRTLSELNRDSGLKFHFDWEMKANSDHYPFFQAQVPTLMFHTGLHNDYHRPSDDAHRVNPAGMERVSQLMFQLVYDLANRPQTPKFRAAAKHEGPVQQKSLDAAIAPEPPRLGVMWDEKSRPGLLVTQVLPGHAAASAGMRSRDRLLKLNGEPIEDEKRFRRDILTARSPVVFDVERDGKPERIEVRLNGSPVRVGVTWREDSGEPGTVILSRITPTSPAERAGLQVGDRIYLVAGKAFQNAGEFQTLVTESPSPLELAVERSGIIRTVAIDLP